MLRSFLLLLLCWALTLFGQVPGVLTPFPLHGTRGAVAGGSPFAVEAGMRMFCSGGNAVDAGVAMTLAAAVCEFSHFGFGGEAPILVRTPEGKVFSIAGVGTMPRLASREYFRNRGLRPGEVRRVEPGGLKDFIPVAGLMPALVPGMVDAVLLALREFGTKSFAEVVEPAIELARGFPLDEIRARSIARSQKFLALWPTSLGVFLPTGSPPRPGEIFRQPDLERTLRALVAAERDALADGASRRQAIDAVRDYFYRGPIARQIGSFCQAQGALLRYEDLAAFRLELEEPVSTTYRGYTVYKPGFWSQGPVMIQTLHLIEEFPLAELGHNSVEYIHLLVEAMKLAYADRDTYYGDPKYVRVPAAVLLSREYAAARRKLITKRASLEFRPGEIPGYPALHPSKFRTWEVPVDAELLARDTTCVSAMDKDGYVFSATPSGAWMPAVIAGNTGIPLTQRAQSFLLIDGHPNVVEGGKRPRVTLSPAIVTTPRGTPYLALSTPGGDNQDQALL